MAGVAAFDDGGGPFEVVVITSSYGGLAPVECLLAGLPADFGTPIVLVHHRAAGADDEFQARLLGRRSAVPVRVAAPGMLPRAGLTLVPAGVHVEFDVDHRLRTQPVSSAAERRSAGDKLFVTAAATHGERVIGVVLTGRLTDGTEGARAIKRAGGRVLAQDPAEASAPGMPVSAIATGCVDFVLPAALLAPALVALTMGPGAAELFAVPTPSWARLQV